MAKPDNLRGEWREGEPMARHTSWGVGGPAERFFRPADLADLQNFLRQTPPDEPLFWLGLGSNLLIRDGGIHGTVIVLSQAFKGINLLAEGQVRAEAGVTCARLARFCADASLGGAAFFAGIPGSVGGALAMNAGCYGTATWAQLTHAETIDRQGTVRVRQPAEFQPGYRQVHLPPEEWFIAAVWQLTPADSASERVKIRTLLQQRALSQPLTQRSCGSVFRNPSETLHAGRLIEAAGLKGYRRGDAQVSEKHANFIINRGHARAADIEALILHVQAVVEQHQGVRLLPEVRVTGVAV
jgi:UDP-N-acetylmuramate dehydrogenase